MNLLLLERVRQRAANPNAATDGADALPSHVHPALSREQIQDVERRLGFRLPVCMARVYAEVGDGGFGPGYGLLGLVDGAKNEDGLNVVGLYEAYMQPSPDDPQWRWPDRLLPVVHVGCGMLFCVGCDSPPGPVVWFEPNPHEQGTPWDDAFIPLGIGFEEMLALRAEGKGVFSLLQDSESPPEPEP